MTTPFDQQTYAWMNAPGSQKHWEKIGLKRRAGVATPLFSLHSKKSIGIGEIPDLKLLIDWCAKTRLSIIQLLPLNDTGFNFTPYDARSMFALDPMYLRIEDLKGVSLESHQKALAGLRRKFKAGKPRVDYRIKRAKIEILHQIFLEGRCATQKEFKAFKVSQSGWLAPYAMFAYLKSQLDESAWWTWPEDKRRYDPALWEKLDKAALAETDFQQWMQWQLFLQMEKIKAAATENDVLFMGDIPFLVSRDSADVWANQTYFKQHLCAGAPPDLYFADGQNWGMPPYDWDAIEANQYDYLVQKLKYAENFYHLFRIDHFVGIFRIWTIDPQTQQGIFDPADENLWEHHGKKLLDVMLSSTEMLPCAEDLGTVPDCSYSTLQEYGLVGMDVLRWQRHWGKGNHFKSDNELRPNSIAVVSTHDMVDLKGWWECEAGSVDEKNFRYKCQEHGLDPESTAARLFDLSRTREGRLFWKNDLETFEQFLALMERPADQIQYFVEIFRESAIERKQFWSHIGMQGPLSDTLTREMAEKTLAKANSAVSIFSIQLLQDWLGLSVLYEGLDPLEFRINRPGTVSEGNWSVSIPISLEKMLQMKENQVIKELTVQSDRA